MLTLIIDNAWPILLILFFFGGSIFVHEYGHFLAARKRGLKVERFSIGFGPKLYAWVKDGVEYRISLLPLGGYVALPQLGDMESIEGSYDKTALPPISYSDKIIVIVMGAVFNVLFAFLLATILWVVGLPVSPQEKTTTIGYVAAQVYTHKDVAVVGPAYKKGLRPGDTILAVDGNPVESFSAIKKYVALGAGRNADGLAEVRLSILRDGKKEDILLEPALVEMNSLSKDTMRVLGIEPAETLKIARIQPNSPAEKIRLQPGDILLSVNQEKLYSLHSLSDILQKNPKETVTLEITRDTKPFSVALRPQEIAYTKPLMRMDTEDGQSLSLLSCSDASHQTLEDILHHAPLALYEADSFKHVHSGDILISINGTAVESFVHLETILQELKPASDVKLLFKKPTGETYSLEMSLDKASVVPSRTVALIGIELDQSPILTYENPFKQIGKNIAMTYQTLSSLVHSKTDIQLKHLMGPPGIMRTFHSFSSGDIRLVLWFTLMLNINLAILNLLPIPVLDGGHILFASLGKIFGKDIPSKVIAKIQGAFMLLLFSLMLYASFFDICRWQGDRQDNKAFEKEKLLYISPEFTQELP